MIVVFAIAYNRYVLFQCLTLLLFQQLLQSAPLRMQPPPNAHQPLEQPPPLLASEQSAPRLPVQGAPQLRAQEQGLSSGGDAQQAAQIQDTPQPTVRSHSLLTYVAVGRASDAEK